MSSENQGLSLRIAFFEKPVISQKKEKKMERFEEVPQLEPGRPSQTIHGILHHPFEAERPRRILFIRSLEDTNPASVFKGSTTGKREAGSLFGGGVDALTLVQGVKRREIRFFELETLGYKVFSISDRIRQHPLVGATYAERETRFQQMMLLYPDGYEFGMEAFHKEKGRVVLRATLVREETLEETLEREGRAETGHTIEVVPWTKDRPWVDRREKTHDRKTDRVENVVYTFFTRITSAYTAEIEEKDESAGRFWLNLYDSLPLQLARLRKKRPEYSKIPFYSHILKVVEIYRNKRIQDVITVAVREEMPKNPNDHPLKDATYGSEFLLVDWDWKYWKLLSESSLMHPSWLLVFQPRSADEMEREQKRLDFAWRQGMPRSIAKQWKKRSPKEWEWLITAMRDRWVSSWTERECAEELARFRAQLAEDEIETMKTAELQASAVAVPEAVETVVAAPEAVVSEVAPAEESPIVAPDTDVTQMDELFALAEASKKYDSPEPFWEEEGTARSDDAEEEHWGSFARPEVFAEWKKKK